MQKLKCLLPACLMLLATPALHAQKHPDTALFAAIAQADSITFDAFNTHNTAVLAGMFSDSVRFYNDGNGISGYVQTMANFKAMFARTPDLRRELVPGTLEVYPIKDYGAIEEGDHRFTHVENGQKQVGVFHFITVWQLKNGHWKMTEVVSVGHHTSATEHAGDLLPVIVHADSVLFDGFNHKNLDVLKNTFDSSLVLYQDNVGLRNYAATIAAFADLFKKEYTLTRTAVPGTMLVYPLGSDGAIQTGLHRFCHVENGQEQCAVFKYADVWRKKNGRWTITCLITYDH